MAIEKNNENKRTPQDDEIEIESQDANVEIEGEADAEPVVQIDQEGNAQQVTEEDLQPREENFYAKLPSGSRAKGSRSFANKIPLTSSVLSPTTG